MQYRGVYNLSRAVPKAAALVMQPRASRLLHSNTSSHAYFTLDIKPGSVGVRGIQGRAPTLYSIKSGFGL